MHEICSPYATSWFLDPTTTMNLPGRLFFTLLGKEKKIFPYNSGWIVLSVYPSWIRERTKIETHSHLCTDLYPFCPTGWIGMTIDIWLAPFGTSTVVVTYFLSWFPGRAGSTNPYLTVEPTQRLCHFGGC
jgi:hypothetical protein